MSDYGLTLGSVALESAGPITFGPEGILFLADNAAGKIAAVSVQDDTAAAEPEPFDMEDVDARIGSFLGCDRKDVIIQDMAVHPASWNVYLSVQRGRGDSASALILRINRLDNSITDVPLGNVPMAETSISDAPSSDDERTEIFLPVDDEGEELNYAGRTIRISYRPIRTATVTDMAYVNGELLVAGLSNEEFSSKLRRIPFPFSEDMAGTNLEIFHVSHGKWETHAPIRAFVPYEEGRAILATYTCTPLVHFSLSDLEDGAKVVGRTVAEFGAMNRPLDMVSFVDGGEEHLLLANSHYGLLKVDCREIDRQEGLTEPYFSNAFPDPQNEPVGVAREKKDVEGITRLANLNGSYVLTLQEDASGGRHLRSLKTASL
jgi:hypothetical protein